MIYWLKTKSNIDNYGYTYDAYSFPIDTNAIDIDLGAPSRKYNIKKVIGNGAIISGGDFYSPRTIKFSRKFKRDGVSTTGALTTGRLNFLVEYVLTFDDLYLIRDYNGSLQYIRIFPIMGAEKYGSLLISNDIDFTLYCDVPFFQDVALTVTTPFTKDERFYDYEFTNLGAPTPIIFEGTFNSSDTEIKLGVYDNYGILLTRSFSASDTVKIQSADLRVWVNDVERYNLDLEGTPFNLLSGTSILRIESLSDLSDCTVSYRGRHL